MVVPQEAMLLVQVLVQRMHVVPLVRWYWVQGQQQGINAGQHAGTPHVELVERPPLAPPAVHVQHGHPARGPATPMSGAANYSNYI